MILVKAPIFHAIAIGPRRDRRKDMAMFAASEPGHVGDLDQPFTLDGLNEIVTTESRPHGRVPSVAENLERRGFTLALDALQYRHGVNLAAGFVRSSDHRDDPIATHGLRVGI